MSQVNEMSDTQRAKLPKKEFIFPERRAYPINDFKHAMKALAYARWPDNKKDFDTVAKAVAKKFPEALRKFKGGRYAKKYLGKSEGLAVSIGDRCRGDRVHRRHPAGRVDRAARWHHGSRRGVGRLRRRR